MGLDPPLNFWKIFPVSAEKGNIAPPGRKCSVDISWIDGC